MHTRHFFALFAAGLTTAGLMMGCGGGDTSSGGGGAGGTTSSGGTTTTPTTTGGTGGTTTTPTGDGNDSFDQAVSLTIDDQGVQDSLDPPDTDADYYKFTGTKGQAVLILTDAKPNNDPFADGYVDLVVTLFDKDQKQIAQNDDPFPRSTQDSSLFTILPYDGDYYIKVEDFCESELAAAAGGCGADYFPNITDTNYAVGVASLDPAMDGNVQEKEPNDTSATATPFTYSNTGTAGQYYLTVGWGDFAANDKDYFLLHIPADVATALPANTRTTAGISFYPSGTSGDGSSTDAGIVQFIDPTDMSIVAEVDASKGAEAQPPLTADKDYYVVINGTNTGATPFYFLNHSVGGSNPIEAEGSAQGVNDATPQDLTADVQDNGDGTFSYFIEGNLPQGGAMKDVDEFTVDTKGLATISVACGAARSGSGLTSFKVTVLNGATSVGNATEAADKDLLISQLAVPGGATKLTIKLEASGQSATVTSDFYRCGFHFQPAM